MRNKKEWAVYLVFAVVAIGLIIRAHYGMDLTETKEKWGMCF